MRFIRIKVENFAGVASGEVQFGPGLNVLYGPNELGKSTLAEATRAALLLQHSSSFHEPWVPWDTDETPHVEMVFQTEAQRFWRVRKSFGKGAKGKSLLDESKDGVTFTNAAKGRRVDAEIRKLLSWGIPEPGGSGGPKGLPETFLTAVLLPQQDNVTAVFNKRLTEDYDESGKQFLTEALQALATDPMFAEVLAQAQLRVDEAFTSRGNRKGGKTSPWRRISDEIKNADERVRDSREAEEKSKSVQQRISELHAQLMDAEEDRNRARAEHSARKKYFQQKTEIENKLDAARKELARAENTHNDYTQLTAREQRLQKLANELKAQATAAEAAFKAAENQVRLAEEALRSATSEEAAIQRTMKEQQLENKLLLLAADEKTAREAIQQANLVASHAEQVAKIEKQVAELSKQIVKCKGREAAVAGQVDLIKGLRVWERKQNARQRLREAEKSLEETRALRGGNESKQKELNELEALLEATKLPTREELAKFKQLDNELRLAQAALAVGLSVEVNPTKPLVVEASSDDGKKETTKLDSESITIQAESLVKLQIGEIARVVVRGGKPDERETVATLASRRKKQIEPVLRSAGATDLEELEAQRDETDQRKVRVRELRRDIEWNLGQIAAKEDPEAKATAIQQELAQLEAELADIDQDALSAQIALLESHPISDRLRTIDRLLEEQQSELAELRAELARDEERLRVTTTDLESSRTELATAQESLGTPWQEAKANAESQLQQLKKSRETLETELAGLAAHCETAVVSAQERRDQANLALSDAESKRQDLAKEETDMLECLNTCRGELRATKGAFEAVNLDGAKQLVEQLEDEKNQLSPPERPVTVDALKAEEETLSQKDTVIRSIQTQIHNEEGALRHVGGTIAHERHEAYLEALRRKQDEESEMALDYDAWQLLLKTLREAENNEATHLGQAMMGPLTQRFGELTQDRYGKMLLGPGLETHGIEVDGQSRAVERLSVGTREQLSTIFRLTLAEHLESVLLLDDQLAQSDPKRMLWFRDMMRQSARKTQIIVLTCRPGDYLLTDEIIESRKYVMHEDGLIRAANLELLISD